MNNAHQPRQAQQSADNLGVPLRACGQIPAPGRVSRLPASAKSSCVSRASAPQLPQQPSEPGRAVSPPPQTPLKTRPLPPARRGQDPQPSLRRPPSQPPRAIHDYPGQPWTAVASAGTWAHATRIRCSAPSRQRDGQASRFLWVFLWAVTCGESSCRSRWWNQPQYQPWRYQQLPISGRQPNKATPSHNGGTCHEKKSTMQAP
jgi:hypothetical protein